MKLSLRPTSGFRKDVKKIAKRGYDMAKLTKIIDKLASDVPLQANNRDHQLAGNFAGARECHIAPDWLLIYEIDREAGILYLVRTGSHSDLF